MVLNPVYQVAKEQLERKMRNPKYKEKTREVPSLSKS